MHPGDRRTAGISQSTSRGPGGSGRQAAELRSTAAMIATVGEYYTLRCRSSWATYGGVLCGLLGTAAIISAFAWPMH